MHAHSGILGIDEILEKEYLSGYSPQFSLKYKFYYLFLRPVISKHIRQFIQKNIASKVLCQKDFIDSYIVSLAENLFENNILKNGLYPDNYRTAIVLTHDVDSQEGFNNIPRVMEIEAKYNVTSAWYIVPYKYKIDDGIISLLKSSGNEVGIHGFNHDGRLYFSKKIFDERARHISHAISKYQASGFRSPMVHHNLKWLQQLDILYDASCFDYDPYQPFPHSCGMIWPFLAGKFVELPYTLPQDHTLIHYLNKRDIDVWKRKTEWLVRHNGMILVITHPDYLNSFATLDMYSQLLEYFSSIKEAWRCLPCDIARWCLEKSQQAMNIKAGFYY